MRYYWYIIYTSFIHHLYIIYTSFIHHLYIINTSFLRRITSFIRHLYVFYVICTSILNHPHIFHTFYECTRGHAIFFSDKYLQHVPYIKLRASLNLTKKFAILVAKSIGIPMGSGDTPNCMQMPLAAQWAGILYMKSVIFSNMPTAKNSPTCGLLGSGKLIFPTFPSAPEKSMYIYIYIYMETFFFTNHVKNQGKTNQNNL